MKRKVEYNDFLAVVGLEKEKFLSLPENVRLSLAESLNVKLQLIQHWQVQNKILMEFYNDTGKRGLNIYSELLNTKVQILEREAMLRESKIDPLTDVHLQKAKERELKMMEFLEKIRFEKQKAVFEKSVDAMKKFEDVPFTVELSDGELEELDNAIQPNISRDEAEIRADTEDR